MADTVTTEVRSRMMSAIKGKDTTPEKQIRRALHSLGFRYRLHAKDLPGQPDLVFPRYKAVIWINGCFWHGHDCGAAKLPSSRVDYWKPKIARTKKRDAASLAILEEMGWRGLTIWECCLRGRGAPGLKDTAHRAAAWLRAGTTSTVLQGRRAESST